MVIPYSTQCDVGCLILIDMWDKQWIVVICSLAVTFAYRCMGLAGLGQSLAPCRALEALPQQCGICGPKGPSCNLSVQWTSSWPLFSPLDTTEITISFVMSLATIPNILHPFVWFKWYQYNWKDRKCIWCDSQYYGMWKVQYLILEKAWQKW